MEIKTKLRKFRIFIKNNKDVINILIQFGMLIVMIYAASQVYDIKINLDKITANEGNFTNLYTKNANVGNITGLECIKGANGFKIGSCG
jgi:hypothetical protein